MSTPLEIDSAVTAAASQSGLTDVLRRECIEVDEARLPSHMFRRVPDYQQIRRLIRDGVDVPGARLTGRYEYVLREPRGTE